MAVQVIDTLKPKNNGAFPIAEAADIAVSAEQRLPEALAAKAEASALAETNAVVAGKANTTDVNTATANLQGQINQIEISASAEAVVAPEVAAARVGEDGTEYTTLKERLDNSDADINALVKPTNVFDSTMIAVEDEYLKSDGSTGHSELWDITTFIPLVAGNSYTYSGLTDVGSETPVSCFYDSSRNLVGYFKQQTGINKIIVPEGATQVKFSLKKVDLENFEIIKKSSTSIQDINDNITTMTGDISDIQTDVDSISDDISTILSSTEIFDSSMISKEDEYLKPDGSTGHSEMWDITKFIRLNSKCKYTYSGLTDVGTTPVSIFYDKNRNIVDYFRQQTGINVLEIPEGATQVKFSLKKIDLESFSIVEDVQYGLKDVSDEIIKVDEELTENINTKISVRNVREENIDNCAWSWWTSPQVVYENVARNKYYFGHVTSDGTAGIAGFSADNTLKRSKTHLRSVGADDHNGMAIFQNQTGSIGKMYIAFAFEHNTENFIHEYIGVQEHNADLYRESIDIEFPGKVTYAQILKDQIGSAYNESRLMLATRVDITDWYGVFSTTYFGNAWGEPKPIVKADKQYYCIFKQISDESRIVRIIMYSNPNLTVTDTRIRMGFLDMSTGYIYNADGTTKLGSMDEGGVNYTDFDVIIDVAANHRNRLLDVAVSPKDEVYVAYASFTDETDAVYYVYNNGTTAEVVSCGEPFYVPSVYVGGLIFDPTDMNTVYISRKPIADHLSRIEKYTYSSGSYSFDSELYRCTSSMLWAIRPIISPDGKYLIFQLGTCNTGNFEQYNYDAEVLSLE